MTTKPFGAVLTVNGQERRVVLHSVVIRHVMKDNLLIFKVYYHRATTFYRTTKRFSQEELAELCGLHRTYIGSVERHERNVTLSTLEVLASTLGVTVSELLTKHESPSNNE